MHIIMCILNRLDRLMPKNANLINNQNHRADKLAMKIGSNVYRKVFLLILIEFTSHCQALPNHLTIVNDKINLTQAEYDHIFNQVKNQLLTKLHELIYKNDNSESSSFKNYEFCNMTFINDNEKAKADAEYLDIDVWLNNGNNFDSLNSKANFKELSAYDQQIIYNNRIRRSINNPPQFAKFLNKHNQNIPTNDTNADEKQHTIETAVFIDRFLAAKFQNRMQDLKKLVLTIMHQVQLIYNYSSMKTKIRIVIVKYEVLNSASVSPNTADGDIDKYLDNFCSWQARRYRIQPWQSRWDHALMLTGLDLYKELGNGKKNKKVLGLAWVNGMCKPSYSCTLNEGKSFEASFVIAHEMGHSLGILHDGRGNNCDGDKFLMSEKTGPGKVNWSPCSNFYIDNFISRGHAKCLDDNVNPSPELDFARSTLLPGQIYDANNQCKLALGLEYTAYFSTKTPFNDICRELWCITGNWATPSHPALEGTQCSTNGQCYQGQCKTGIGSFDTIQPQPSARSTSKFQSNLVSVQRNYVPVNASNALLSKARIKLLNNNSKQQDKATTMSSITEQTSTKSTVKESTQPNVTKLNKNTNLNTNELNKSSFMEDVRTIVKKIYYMFV